MSVKNLAEDFVAHPSVFAVEDEYQILVPTKCETTMWIDIRGECFFDHANGVLRSDTPIHKIVVPMVLLDEAKEYTVCYRKMINRKSYFSETGDVIRVTYSFIPLEKGKESIRIYHVSDSHSRVNDAIDSALSNGKEFDLFVLDGDVAEDSNTTEKIVGIFEISGNASKGMIPCIYARGNHDLRGLCADRLPVLSPNRNGKTYYTFRLGDIWGMVLDCGEDKNDDVDEYGNTVCCHAFRKEETRFIKETVAKGDFADNGIKYRLVICHMPFTRVNYGHGGRFNIENEIYNEWCRIMNEEIKPHFILSGHVHVCEVIMPGDPMDNRGQKFPVILGGKPCTIDKKEGFTGAYLTLENDSVKVKFTDNTGKEENSTEIRF